MILIRITIKVCLSILLSTVFITVLASLSNLSDSVGAPVDSFIDYLFVKCSCRFYIWPADHAHILYEACLICSVFYAMVAYVLHKPHYVGYRFPKYFLIKGRSCPALYTSLCKNLFYGVLPIRKPLPLTVTS